jgi:hypothetical protein
MLCWQTKQTAKWGCFVHLFTPQTFSQIVSFGMGRICSCNLVVVSLLVGAVVTTQGLAVLGSRTALQAFLAVICGSPLAVVQVILHPPDAVHNELQPSCFGWRYS